MSRRKDDDALGIVIFIFIALIVGAFFIIKWFIIALAVIISAITIGITNSSRKKQNKILVSKLVEENFNNTTFKPVEQITIKEIKDKLGIFDIDVYDDLFEPQIINRGQNYFAERKVKDVKEFNNVWECNIQGTNKYHVTIKFDNNDNDKILYSNCDCPYHREDNKNCKHIYALLMNVKCSENVSTIINALDEFLDKMAKVGRSEVQYINENQNQMHITNELKNAFDNYVQRLQSKLNYANNLVETKNNNETLLLRTFKDLIESSYSFNQEFNELLVQATKKDENPITIAKNYKANKEDRLKMSDVIAGTVIANEIDKKIHKKDDVDEELEKEMDAYDLEDWQKDLVRKGEYNPWNFNEEDLEEGDYYYEDDDMNDE